MKISYKTEEDAQVLLAKLEYDYCLPKAFWTNKEWQMICYYTIGYKSSMREYKEYREQCNRYKDEEDE